MPRSWVRQWAAGTPSASHTGLRCSTLYAGRRARVGYSAVVMGRTAPGCFNRPRARPSSATATARSYQLATPASVQWWTAPCVGGLQQAPQCHREAARPGRRADLVRHDAHLVPAAQQAQHGLHEVVAGRGVQPGGAHHRGIASRGLQHRTLSRRLGFAVHAGGADRIVRAIRAAGRSVEHVVGGHVDQSGAGLDGCARRSRRRHPRSPRGPGRGSSSAWSTAV